MFTAPIPQSQLQECQRWLQSLNLNLHSDYSITDTGTNRVLINFFVAHQYERFCNKFSIAR